MLDRLHDLPAWVVLVYATFLFAIAASFAWSRLRERA